MFKLLRFGMLPVVLFCVVVIVATLDALAENTARKSSWIAATGTVTASQDFGDFAAAFQHRKNDFPDPQGAITYVVDGKAYTWSGRGRDIGLTVLPQGGKVDFYYDPKNPAAISTLVMLGATTGYKIAAAALAFLLFYAWLFWLRGMSRRPDDFDDAPMASSPSPSPPRPTGIAPARQAQSRPRGAFGKR